MGQSVHINRRASPNANSVARPGNADEGAPNFRVCDLGRMPGFSVTERTEMMAPHRGDIEFKD